MNDYKVHFTELAEQDIDEIIDYIAQDSPTNAIRFVENLRDRAVKALGTAPKGGAEFLGARFFPFENYIVVYDIDEANKTVVVHMVAHGARQWRPLFIERFGAS